MGLQDFDPALALRAILATFQVSQKQLSEEIEELKGKDYQGDTFNTPQISGAANDKEHLPKRGSLRDHDRNILADWLQFLGINKTLTPNKEVVKGARRQAFGSVETAVEMLRRWILAGDNDRLRAYLGETRHPDPVAETSASAANYGNSGIGQKLPEISGHYLMFRLGSLHPRNQGDDSPPRARLLRIIPCVIDVTADDTTYWEEIDTSDFKRTCTGVARRLGDERYVITGYQTGAGALSGGAADFAIMLHKAWPNVMLGCYQHFGESGAPAAHNVVMLRMASTALDREELRELGRVIKWTHSTGASNWGPDPVGWLGLEAWIASGFDNSDALRLYEELKQEKIDGDKAAKGQEEAKRHFAVEFMKLIPDLIKVSSEPGAVSLGEGVLQEAYKPETPKPGQGGDPVYKNDGMLRVFGVGD